MGTGLGPHGRIPDRVESGSRVLSAGAPIPTRPLSTELTAIDTADGCEPGGAQVQTRDLRDGDCSVSGQCAALPQEAVDAWRRHEQRARSGFRSLAIHIAAAALLPVGGWVGPARAQTVPAQASATGPNIVIILADDLGWGDVKAMRPESTLETPRIDSIAEAGMRFTDAHSAAAVCTPSRYALLTGQYGWRSRQKQGVIGEDFDRPVIDAATPTLGGMLQRHGYRTAAVGKWHLALTFPKLPEEEKTFINRGYDLRGQITGGPFDRGFHEFFGTYGNIIQHPHAYIRDNRLTAYPDVLWGRPSWPYIPIRYVAPDYDPLGVLDRLTQEAVGFIDRSAAGEAPFFLYFALTAPHVPLIPASRFQGTSGLGPYGDFVAHIDWTVGQVLDALDRAGVADDTLVIFTSDNGSTMDSAAEWERDHSENRNVNKYRAENHKPNGEFRGIKGDIYEGGHRVPFLVRWPGVVPANSESAYAFAHVDIYATLAHLLGAQLGEDEAIDSLSILPVLRGETAPPRRSVVHHSAKGMFAVRDGPWKLVFGNGSGGWFGSERHGSLWRRPYLLYELSGDPAESRSVLGANPAVASRLEGRLNTVREATSRSQLYSGDASLDGLALSGVDIGEFDEEVTTYAAQVPAQVTSTTVSVTPADEYASVVITDGTTSSRGTLVPVELGNGGNTITVAVTAENRTTTMTYTVVVTRGQAVLMAPDITSASGYAVVEGETSVAALAATDADTPATDLHWSIPPGPEAGADGGRFTITPGGALAFTAAKDFEAPDDADGDGTYQVTVHVTDGEGRDTADLAVTLSNRNEAPTANAGPDQLDIAEGATVTLTGTATDPDAGDTLTHAWAQTAGPQVALSDAAVATPTFAAPTGLTHDATLAFTLRVTDQSGLNDEDAVSVVVKARPPPVATIAAGGSPVTEGTAATFAVSLDAPAAAALAVAVSVSETGASLSGPAPATVEFAEGESSKALSLATADDLVVEADSTVTATVTAGTGYTLGPAATASVTVEDDDAATLTVSAEQATISEGGSVTLTVRIANGVTFAEAQTISLATSGTASAADYTGVSPTLTLAAGATSATATLVAAADDEEEEAETVTVAATHGESSIGSVTVTIHSISHDATLAALSLSGVDIGTFSDTVTAYTASVAHSVMETAVTATATHPEATVSINPGSEVSLAVGSNEIAITVMAEDGTTTRTYAVTVTRASLPVATIAAGATSVAEGTSAIYTVSLDQAAPEALTVAVSVTESGTTVSGSPPASVSIAKGATSATLTVPTAGDSVVEADSTVTASVTAGTGYTIGTAATASVTVEDDDAATFTVSAEAATISEGGSATLTVAIANGVTFAEAQTISLATSGTASAADYTGVPPTLTLAAGATSATATLVAAADDAEEEAETVTVTASHGGSPVGSATVTVHSVSRDATLRSLSLSGVDIGTFSGATTTYQASVENPVTATTVAATASHSGATAAIEPGAEVALAEGANRITVTVTAEDGTTTQTYTVTVTRASLPVVSIVAVEERPAGPVGVFRLSRTGPTTKPLEVQVLRASTRWRSDRLVTVRFPAGEASVTGRIQIGDNNLVEDDTTVTWTLQQGEGYTLSAEQASASLVLAESDVPEFAVSVEPAAIAEGESATFTVAITNGVRFAEAQTISLAASGTAGVADYTGLTAALKLAARESSATATLAAVADQEAEEAETLTLTASHGNSTIGSATVTIHSVSRDATLASLRLSGIDIGTFSGAVTAYRASVWHGVGTTTVTATASHPGATVTIDPGAEVSLVEGANEIRVTVTAEDGTRKTYTVTVTRAGPPVVSIVPVEERLTGPIGEFRLSRTGPTAEPLEVRVLFSSSRSSTGRPLTVRFSAGQASVTRRVQAGDNNLVEAEIAITWTLQQGEGYTLSAEHAAASLVLEESDVPEFAVAVEPAAVAADLLAELGVETGGELATIAADLLLRLGVEPGDDPARIAEGSAATLTVEITNGVRFAEAQTIAIEVAGGTASSGTDFTLSSQSLTLPRRADSTTVTLQARNDDDDGEGDETVSVTARHAGQAIARQTLTIANRKLEAKFIKVPESHDGETAFVFELWLSKAARVFSAEEDSSDAVRWGKAFEELEGSLTKARRLAPGSDPPAEVADRRWELTVRPASDADIVLTLPVTTDCSAEGALCTAGGSKHWRRVSVTVAGPGESEQAEEGFPLAPENSLPSGIWSDGETAWVADLDDARLYAYRRSDGERQPAQDIATESVPMGLWADGDTIWVAGLKGGLRAHRLADGARVVDRDLALEANETPAGVWSDGETAWVSTWLGQWVHAYRLADGARVAGRDIRLSGENLMPVGVWSDGETLWVADWRERLYAYRLSDGRRVPQRDIEAGAGDTDPTGLWSGGGTLLSTGWGGREVRAYRLPADVHTPAAEDRATSRDAGEGSVPMIGDPVLGAAIRKALGKGPGEAVSAADLAGLESLNVRNGGVRDLSGLEVLTGLTELDLGFNPLADPRQLASLPALESLNLDGSILDLGPLASLQGLRQLSVRHNLLDDLQPLAALTGLTELDIGDNRVEDLRPLGGLAGLAGLRADRNGIADLWPLASLTGLEVLDLGANRIRDAQPLAGLEQLKVLRLDGNGLVELHPLARLLGLTDLGLAGTGVENLRAVAGMDGLRRLDLRGNAVGDLRPLTGLPSLVWVHVGGSRIGDLSPLDGVDGLTVAGREDREAPSPGHGGVRQQGGDE